MCLVSPSYALHFPCTPEITHLFIQVGFKVNADWGVLGNHFIWL